MSRSYSDKFILSLKASDPDNPGIALGLACVNANLPAKYVADALGVTRMTVFSWFRGSPIRFKTLQRVEVFTDLVESDTAKGRLPARTKAEAQAYLEEMIGRPLGVKSDAKEESVGTVDTPEPQLA